MIIVSFIMTGTNIEDANLEARADATNWTDFEFRFSKFIHDQMPELMARFGESEQKGIFALGKDVHIRPEYKDGQ